ncbi:MAG TPA: SapC family protein [Burkholderiaceae bacterium]|jgi:hypothetical protein
MTRPVLLDNVNHRRLRVHSGRSASFGDARQFALALPAEFRQLQAYFPIVFQSIEGTYQPLALFGLEPEQNLFLQDDRWDAPVVPMALQRDPFLIGRSGDELKLHVDMDSPRIVKPEEGEVGTAVFMPHGGHSEYLDHMVSLLEHLHAQAQALPAFIDALTTHQLLEPFVLDIELSDGNQGRLSGLHTIHEERLAALPGEVLEKLQRDGHLLPIYMQLASLSRLQDLVERQNRSHRSH